MNPSFASLIGTLFTNKSFSIYDPEYQKHLQEAPWKYWLSQNNYFNVKDEYIETFVQWIHSSKNNSFSDSLTFKSQRYQRRDIIVGTTQSFDEAYFRYHNRRLRLFRGEYGYHRRCYKNQLWLDHCDGTWADPLDEKDWIIISHPFCGTGDEHPKFKDLLDRCSAKQIPVVVDCAWFGTCFNINFDFEHPAISEVSFSLSKGIGLGSMRTGLRFSNYSLSEQMPIAQQNLYNHLVLDNCQIGLWQMSQFDPDWSYRKYIKWYQMLCKAYKIKNTKCLHISLLDIHNEYTKFFLIDNIYARVGVREALKAMRRKELVLTNI